jgi:hypothetical protein
VVLSVVLAGVTSSISLALPAVAFLEDEFNLTRKEASVVFAVVTFILCQPVIFFLGNGVLDEMDFWAIRSAWWSLPRLKRFCSRGCSAWNGPGPSCMSAPMSAFRGFTVYHQIHHPMFPNHYHRRLAVAGLEKAVFYGKRS